jgi:hypothetical protein
MPETNLLVIIVLFQSATELIIVVFVILKLGEVLNRIDKLSKDINELWKTYRFFRGSIKGLHNRLVIKIGKKFKELDVETDFSSEMYESEDNK